MDANFDILPRNYVIKFDENTHGLLPHDEIETLTTLAFKDLIAEAHNIASSPYYNPEVIGKSYEIVVIQDENSSNMHVLDGENFDEWQIRSETNPITRGKVKSVYRFMIPLNSATFELTNSQDFHFNQQIKTTHDIEVTPAFSPLRVFTRINLYSEEYFSNTSFFSLIKSTKLFVLAVAQSGTSPTFTCFDASKLNGEINPITKEKIGIIFFYTCTLRNKDEIFLEPLAHSRELDQKKVEFRECFFRAAEGNVAAQRKLGYYYQQGVGTTIDDEKAFFWFSKAAEKCEESNLEKAICLFIGCGVAKQPNKARDIFNKLTTSKKPKISQSAKYHLGYYYFKDNEFAKAKSLFQDLYNKDKANNEYRYYFASCLVSSLIKKDVQNGMQHFKELAAQGFVNALGYLATFYLNLGGARNQIEAFKYFQRGAELESVHCTAKLGELYLKGIGVKKDVQKALEIFHLEIFKKRGDYCYKIGCALGDLRKEVAPEHSFNFFKRGADLGHEISLQRLAMCYIKGIGVEVDVQKGEEIVKILAGKGEIYSLYTLGNLYIKKKDTEDAGVNLLEEASNKNYLPAYIALGEYYLGHENIEMRHKAFGYLNICLKLAMTAKNIKIIADVKMYLSQCFYAGLGIAKDEMMGVKLLHESAAGGNKHSLTALTIIRSSLEKDL
jgi:TPR repeat protein